MRRKGPWWDNAVAESVCQTLQTAGVSLEPCATRAQAQEAIGDSMEGVSNRQRRHAANGHLAPVLYEPSQKAAEFLVRKSVDRSVAVWCPQLRNLSGAALRIACEDLKQQAGTDADVVRNIYQSLEGLDGFPPASVLDAAWVLFRWVQVHLLFALDYVSRYGFSDRAMIPKRVEHDIHDIQYVLFGTLCGALATRDRSIACNFTLACPEGTCLHEFEQGDSPDAAF